MNRSMKRLLLTGLLAVGALASATALRADGPYLVPEALEAPAGHSAYLVTHAHGTQNFVCLPGVAGTGLGWTFLGPQATGFDDWGEQVLTHYLSANPFEDGVARPVWQSSHDTSAVWAKPIASSTDPDFVAAGAVPWLLLEAQGGGFGPTGGDELASTTYIQRVLTVGGVPPAGRCPGIGAKAMVPYAAVYVFYRQD